MAGSPELIGKDAVLDVYSDYDGQTFALFRGKRLIVTGEGAADLEKWIDRFAPSGSTGTFGLRLYDDLDPDKVKVSTDYTCSFDFKIVDSYGGMGITGHRNSLGARLEAIEKKLNEEPDNSGSDLQEIVFGWLREPHKLATVIGAVRALILPNAPPMPAMQPAQAIGSVQPANQQFMNTPASETEQDQEQLIQRLSSVLDRLQAVDPDILPHLEKLATIGETKPEMFKMLINSLNAF